MLFATRLCWNTNRWQSPSGDAKEREAGSTFSREYGFGHEEWLFRHEWELDGWRYGFIQGVNKGRKTQLKRGLLDVVLYTIDDNKQRRFVAAIDELEVLTDQAAQDALDAFKANGWFETMLEEVSKAGGDSDVMRNQLFPWNTFNVRYRVENATFEGFLSLVPPDHPIQKNNRYQLVQLSDRDSAVSGGGFAKRGRSARTSQTSVVPGPRKGSIATTVDPIHNRMQQRLCAKLAQDFPTLKVVQEKDFVDVLAEDQNTVRLYEIKSELNSRTVLRHAIGQLLEYAYHGKNETRQVVLVAVGRKKLEKADLEYLNLLRHKFNLVIEYLEIAGD